MSDNEVKIHLAGLDADDRFGVERFLASWDCMHGRETAEDEESRLEALKGWIKYGEG